MSRTVLIVASHPDDEILGAGATLARHAAEGDAVHILILAEGATARPGADGASETAALRSAAEGAARAIGAAPPRLLGLPDNRLDSLDLLDVVQPIERAMAEIRPCTVYTHFHGDLNRDHGITAEAVEIACRPLPGQSVRALHAFETMSSTEWGVAGGTFAPNLYVDIATHLDMKIRALKCYESEMRSFPHARSYEAIEALARLRGAQSGLAAAEAFVTRRELRP